MSQGQRKSVMIDTNYTLIFAVYFLAVAFAGFFLLALSLLFLLNRKLGISYLNDITTLSDLQEKLPMIVLVTGVVQAAMSCLVMFLLSLLWAHAVAGPLIRVRRLLEMMRHGQWMDNIAFRRDDQLHELAEVVRNCQSSCQDRREEFISYVQQAEHIRAECELAALSSEMDSQLSDRIKNLKKVYLNIKQLLAKERP